MKDIKKIEQILIDSNIEYLLRPASQTDAGHYFVCISPRIESYPRIEEKIFEMAETEGWDATWCSEDGEDDGFGEERAGWYVLDLM